ncbi:MAG: diguanylate cyclase [Acholeplasmatales bacterium]|nr:MAG: diguanylate cyclase [Acholeplasmatales bacterium]
MGRRTNIESLPVPLALLEFDASTVNVTQVNALWLKHLKSQDETNRFLTGLPFHEKIPPCDSAVSPLIALGRFAGYELVCLPLHEGQAMLIASRLSKDDDTLHRHMIENIRIASYVIEPGAPHSMIYCNPYMETLTGYSLERFCGSEFYTTCIHEEDVDRILLEVNAATQDKLPFEFTYRFQRADGRWMWVYERGRAIFDAHGETLYYVGTLMDVSEGKTVRNILKRQQQLLDAILKATRTILEAEDIDAALDDCFNWLGAALNVGRIYLYKNGARDGELYTGLTHEWTAPSVHSVLEDPAQQNIPFSAMPEFFEPLQNGKPFEHIVDDIHDDTLREHLEAQDIKSILVFPVVVHERFYGFVGFDDISESRPFTTLERDYLESFTRSLATGLTKKEDAAALTSQSQLFQTIFEAIDSGLAVFDSSMRVMHVNEAMLPYMISPFEPGAPCTRLFKDNFIACENCPVKKAFKTKATSTDYRQLRHHDTLIDVEIKAYPMLNDAHAVQSVVQVVRNISEQKAYESTLRTLSETDYLTGVYNRAYFEQALLHLDESNSANYAILSLDIDGLKLINDTLGTDVGNRILNSLGHLLKGGREDERLVGRMGGDEFAVLYKNQPSSKEIYDEIEVVASALYRHLSEGYEAIPKNLLSFSYGVAVYDESLTAFEVLRRADDMMYSQKLRKGQSAKSTIVKTLISTLKARDYETERHGERLQHYVNQLGQAFDLAEADIALLETLAEVHDIGKIGIPDAILLKPGPLSEQEWEIMKTHPEKGYRIASNSPDLMPVADLILKHHEHYDGTGYPFGLANEEIPFLCRVLAVCDAYDAMTSHRPYRKALSQQEAIAELRRCRGSQFDPEVVDRFIKAVLGET